MTFSENRKARHDYHVLERFEGGLVLTGQEVKAIREGGAKIDGAYVTITGGEIWLFGAHIRPYSKANRTIDVDPDRKRKILLHEKEIAMLVGKTQQKGLTLVPLLLYSRGRQIKLAFALCRGKKAHDKRDAIKTRDLDRTIRQHLRGHDIE